MTAGQPEISTAEDAPARSMNAASQVGAAIVWGFPERKNPISWLAPGDHSLGRDTSCSIVLPSMTLSRRHARLRAVGKLWIIEDANSRNGLFVNGQRVQQTALVAGDTLRVGEWVGSFVEIARSAEPAFRVRDDGLFCGPSLGPALARAELLAKSSLPLVLQGETGTGKELFARAIHAASGLRGRFVAVNCSVYQRENAAAELFGYRRGAFTGAERAHEGHVLAAHEGTLFLDEISELAPSVQPDLLRVLQEGELMRLGESRPTRVNARVIVATQAPLANSVQKGSFRADLRARLEGAVIELPPLRKRREEVVPLFLRLLTRELGTPVQGMDPRLLERLACHTWPLNVRELSLLVKKLVVIHRGGTAWTLEGMVDELPSLDLGTKPAPPAETLTRAIRDQHEDQQAQTLIDALQRCGGNLSRAAAELNISRQRAYRLLKAHEGREG